MSIEQLKADLLESIAGASDAAAIEQIRVAALGKQGSVSALLKTLGGGRPLPANLFYFHGPAGVGKSFLLQWWRGRVDGSVLWFDLMQLLKAFQSAHQDKRVDRLREELVQERPLVIDELHRIAGKPKLQQFVADVLRAREHGRQPTLLAGRWHPRDVRDLDEHLATLLLAGFVAGVDRPGPLARLRYLRALEGAPSRNGRAQAVESLAQQVTGSYPELRAAWAQSRGATLPPKYLELIDPGRVFARCRDQVTMRFAVTTQDLVGKAQGRQVSRARKVLAVACLRAGLNGGEIGRFLGGRTRAAVSYMARSLDAELRRSPELRAQVEDLL